MNLQELAALNSQLCEKAAEKAARMLKAGEWVSIEDATLLAMYEFVHRLRILNDTMMIGRG